MRQWPIFSVVDKANSWIAEKPTIIWLFHQGLRTTWEQMKTKGYLRDNEKFLVEPIAYFFGDFHRGWGDYFHFTKGDRALEDSLSYLQNEGLTPFMYVDPTECSSSFSKDWNDSIIAKGNPLDRMSLNPNLSWSKHIKDGMTSLTDRLGVRTFAIDRFDLCDRNEWGEEILKPRPRGSYVMNTLRDDQAILARYARFIGSDGVPAVELDTWNKRYQRLSLFTTQKQYYLAPWYAWSENRILDELKAILQVCPAIVLDDYSHRFVEPILWES